MLNYNEVIYRLDSGDIILQSEVEQLLASNDGYLRWAGLKALGLQKMKPSVFLIPNSICSPQIGLDDEDLTTIAAWSLSQIPEEAKKLVSNYSTSEKRNIRILVADLLGLIEHPNEIAILGSLLLDSSNEVAKWAALSLSKKGERALDLLRTSLIGVPSDALTAYLLDALKKIGSKEAKKIAADFVTKTGNEKFLVFLE